MNSYITGSTIRQLREQRCLTQAQLAHRINVSDKAISKWETGKGLPDITLIEPLAAALGVSVLELMSGEPITNRNRSSNVLRSKIYICPICGNVLTALGDAVVSCCGVTLPPQEAEPFDDDHAITLERVEDETYITLNHPMEKGHFISFLAFVTTNGMQFVKLYPEGGAEARMKLRGKGYLYACCNRHGLFQMKI